MENISKFVWFQEGPGVRKTQYTVNGVKLLNVANLVNGKIDLSTSKRYISPEEAYGKYKHFLVDEGDLIIASSGIQVDYFDKKMGFITKEHLPLCMNTSTIRFKTLNKDVLDINYFMYFMKSEQFKSQLRRLITGSAQLNFGSSHLEKIKMNVPNMEKQRECVQKLNTITSAIEIKKQQLDELDNLIKSQFVEMFENEKNYVKLVEVCQFINGDRGKNYPPADEIKQNGDIPFINAGLILNNDVDWVNMNYISKERYEKLSSGKIQRDDILYCLRGSLGKHCIISFDRNGAIASSLLILRVDRNKILPKFLLAMLDTDDIILQQEQANNGSSQPNLSATSVKNYNIKLPSLDKQLEFVNFVDHIDKLEFVKIMKRDSATRLNPFLLNNVLYFFNCFDFLFR